MYLKLFVPLFVIYGILSMAAPVRGGPAQWQAPDLAALSGPVMTLTLGQAIGQALEANRALIRSEYARAGSRFSIDAATAEFEYRFLPVADAGVTDSRKQVGAGLAVEKKFSYGALASVTPRIGRSEDEYSSSLGVSMATPLLRGFGREVTTDALQGTRFAYRSADRSLYRTRVNTVLETVSAVYDITLKKALVALYEDQTQRFREHVLSAKIKENVGLAESLDIYRAQIRLKDAENNLTRAAAALKQSEDRLKLILAVPVSRPVAVTAPVVFNPVKIELSEAVRIAEENRVELEQARDDVDEAKRRSRIAKNSLLPQLDLKFDYERFGSDTGFNNSIRFDDERWQLNLLSGMDLRRSVEKARYQQALLSIRAARLTLAGLSDEIIREVRTRFDNLTESGKRIAIREEQIRQAKGSLLLAQAKFNHGMTNNFDVIEAETEYQRAKTSLLEAKRDYIVGTYQMRAAIGTLVQK